MAKKVHKRPSGTQPLRSKGYKSTGWFGGGGENSWYVLKILCLLCEQTVKGQEWN